MRRPRVVLADDHRVVLEGLVGLLGPTCELVDTVGDGRALIEAVTRLDPDVVVADISLPLLSGIDALVHLKKKGIRAKVIFLTMHRDVAYVTRALEEGASGFVLKHSASSELLTAIRDVLHGKTYVTPLLDGRAPIRSRSRFPDRISQLTPRQREVLRLVAQGRSAKEIGAVLNISPRTVEFHRNKIKEELRLRSHSELVQFALKHGVAVLVTWIAGLPFEVMV